MYSLPLRLRGAAVSPAPAQNKPQGGSCPHHSPGGRGTLERRGPRRQQPLPKLCPRLSQPLGTPISSWVEWDNNRMDSNRVPGTSEWGEGQRRSCVHSTACPSRACGKALAVFGNAAWPGLSLSTAAMHTAGHEEQQRTQKPDLQSPHVLQGEEGTNQNKTFIKNKSDTSAYAHTCG